MAGIGAMGAGWLPLLRRQVISEGEGSPEIE